MKINKSNVTFSSIVGIGQKIKKVEEKIGESFLHLNRGVNDVVGIDLKEVMPKVKYNTKLFQTYAPNLGLESLRKSIVEEYFPTQSFYNSKFFENICITPGGMPSLDIIIQTLDIEKIYFPYFYWGSYSKMATIRKKEFFFYKSLDELNDLTEGDCVFVCDPSNPTGIKLDDNYLYEKLSHLNNLGCTIIFDCPYRKLFFQDNFFDKLVNLQNVIVSESFSKWVGLSGLRLGFIMCQNEEFNDELNIRMLYEFNGVSSPSQLVVDNVLSTEEGKQAHKIFREQTTEHIENNIIFLKENNLLVDEIYGDKLPLGIFAVINRTEKELFDNKIGSVGLDKFVSSDKEHWEKYSRICVSINQFMFKKHFNNFLYGKN
jgi:aspartate aminotransferase